MKRIALGFLAILLLAVLLCVSASAATLQKGDEGAEVVELQKELIAQGYLNSKADGDYGNVTAKAVAAFQKATGLPETGIADDTTQDILFGRMNPDGSYKELLPIQESIFAAGYGYAVGILPDGKVIGSGKNDDGCLNVSQWRDIVAVDASYHTVGLKKDGTVVATGMNNMRRCNVSSWRNIIAVSAGALHTVGLKNNGTVVAVGSNDEGQLKVEKWSDIIQVAAGGWHTVGLYADGTVVAIGYNEYGQCNVSSWRDIVAISAGYWTTVGLKSNGEVVYAGAFDSSAANALKKATSWRGIQNVKINGGGPIIGIKMDGSVIDTWDAYSKLKTDGHRVMAVDFDQYTNTCYGFLEDGTVSVIRAGKYADVSGWKLRIPSEKPRDNKTIDEIDMSYIENGNYQQENSVVLGKTFIGSGRYKQGVAWYNMKNGNLAEAFIYDSENKVLNYAFNDEKGDYWNYIFSYELNLVMVNINDKYFTSYQPNECPIGWISLAVEDGIMKLVESKSF